MFFERPFLDSASLYGHINYRSKSEMADRTGSPGAVLNELESRNCSYLGCIHKIREGMTFYKRYIILNIVI